MSSIHTSRISRYVAVAAVSTAVSMGMLAAPAEASPAGGGEYAASVATRTLGNGVQTGKNTVQLRGWIKSTSSSVSQLHGTVKLSMYRAQSGGLVARRIVGVSGASGRTYTTNVTIPTTIPRGSRSTYYVVAVFYPRSGHIEKRSHGSNGFFHLY